METVSKSRNELIESDVESLVSPVSDSIVPVAIHFWIVLGKLENGQLIATGHVCT